MPVHSVLFSMLSSLQNDPHALVYSFWFLPWMTAMVAHPMAVNLFLVLEMVKEWPYLKLLSWSYSGRPVFSLPL